jgi:hypothetical protein
VNQAVGAGQDSLNQAVGTGQDSLNQALSGGEQNVDQAVEDVKQQFAETSADNSDYLASSMRESPIRRRLNKRADFSCTGYSTRIGRGTLLTNAVGS